MVNQNMEVPIDMVALQGIQDTFLGLPLLAQIIVIACIVAVTVLVGMLVFYILKGVAYLIYYIFKGVFLLIAAIAKGIYKLGKAIVKHGAKILEEIGDTIDDAFNSDITPAKVGAAMSVSTQPVVEAVPTAKFCTQCGTEYTENMEEALHNHGACFCQACGAQTTIHA